ncbi:hypothetical protein KKC63_00255 [Patescibacteria group bacterium]|nr:hypothetical protein [Patescibacteria group bacterium]MBU4078400.1 hypothetical protein [Patescibacteria group bacterium]
MPDKKHYPLIRTIYLYIFALLGLVLVTIGAVNFLNMGLKAFVFTKADQNMEINFERPISSPLPVEKMEEFGEGSELSEEELALVQDWLEEYKIWQTESGKINYLVSDRHRSASINLSLILIGIPLYLYYWATIKREMKKEKTV